MREKIVTDNQTVGRVPAARVQQDRLVDDRNLDSLHTPTQPAPALDSIFPQILTTTQYTTFILLV